VALDGTDALVQIDAVIKSPPSQEYP